MVTDKETQESGYRLQELTSKRTRELNPPYTVLQTAPNTS